MNDNTNPSFRIEYNEAEQSHNQQKDSLKTHNDNKKNLLIIFVKNIRLGKVKTRLAKTIGNEGAFEVYKHLVKITEKVSEKISVDKHIYFSDTIIEEKWPKSKKFIQKGVDLGQKMQNSIKKGFEDGYEKIILIGSDLPDISPQIIYQGFDKLNKKSIVFGPAEDGGYYLIGLTQQHNIIFKNKPWSQSNLLTTTLDELTFNKISFSLLKSLNDIDTVEDLKNSPLKTKFEYLIP